MIVLKAPVLGCMLYVASAGLAWAQPDVTGTGGGPLTAETAPNTTALGQTKPPSRAASPTASKPIGRRTSRQVADDAISTRICIGCRVDPGSTGSLPNPPAAAPITRDVRLDELRTLAEPNQQPDLDTLSLASAHREQARSAQEKTDGLWQSWLVSVCNGCGDQKPAQAQKLEDWPTRDAAATTGAVDRKLPPPRVRAATHPHGNLAADLSPENVGGIRRMP